MMPYVCPKRSETKIVVTCVRNVNENKTEVTWVYLLQMFLQQAAVQQELEPGGLKRRAGPAAGHGSYPVRCLRTHLPLVESDTDVENMF